MVNYLVLLLSNVSKPSTGCRQTRFFNLKLDIFKWWTIVEKCSPNSEALRCDELVDGEGINDFLFKGKISLMAFQKFAGFKQFLFHQLWWYLCVAVPSRFVHIFRSCLYNRQSVEELVLFAFYNCFSLGPYAGEHLCHPWTWFSLYVLFS